MGGALRQPEFHRPRLPPVTVVFVPRFRRDGSRRWFGLPARGVPGGLSAINGPLCCAFGHRHSFSDLSLLCMKHAPLFAHLQFFPVLPTRLTRQRRFCLPAPWKLEGGRAGGLKRAVQAADVDRHCRHQMEHLVQWLRKPQALFQTAHKGRLVPCGGGFSRGGSRCRADVGSDPRTHRRRSSARRAPARKQKNCPILPNSGVAASCAAEQG